MSTRRSISTISSSSGTSNLGLSEHLVVRPGQQIIDTDLSRFKSVTIQNDSATGLKGQLLLKTDGRIEVFNDTDLIVAEAQTINQDSEYSSITFLPTGELTITT